MNNIISIILPTYNGSKWIKSSVQSVIDQSYTNWELLIIDDGSTDTTEQIVREFSVGDSRIRYIKNEVNLGIQKTLNKGIREAKGDYIARIDDDDLWCDKDKLKKQIQFMEHNPEYVLVGTGVVIINESGDELFRYLLPDTDQKIKARLLGKNCFVHSSVMFTKSSVVGFNGYSESQNTRHLEDYELWLKLGTIGKIHNIPSYAVKFTLRDGSLSSVNKLEQFKKSIQIIKGFKNSYPNYFFAVVRSVVRLIIYGFILKLPIKLSLNKLIKFYKENW